MAEKIKGRVHPWPTAWWLLKQNDYVVDSEGRRYYDAIKTGPSKYLKQINEHLGDNEKLFWIHLPRHVNYDSNEPLQFPEPDTREIFSLPKSPFHTCFSGVVTIVHTAHRVASGYCVIRIDKGT